MENKSKQNVYGGKSGREPFIRFSKRIVLFMGIAVFSVCFIVHMLEINTNPEAFFEANYGIKAPDSTREPEEQETTPPLETLPQNPYAVINPVPRSPQMPASYWDTALLIGGGTLADLFGVSEVKHLVSGVNLTNIGTKEVDGLSLIGKVRGGYDNIYIMLGGDEVATADRGELTSRIKDFIEEVRKAAPVATVYVMPLPPVTEQSEKEGGVKNAVIDNFNSALLKMANEEAVYYVDINTALKSNSGTLPTAYVNDDGKFKESAKQLACEYLLTRTIGE